MIDLTLILCDTTDCIVLKVPNLFLNHVVSYLLKPSSGSDNHGLIKSCKKRRGICGPHRTLKNTTNDRSVYFSVSNQLACTWRSLHKSERHTMLKQKLEVRQKLASKSRRSRLLTVVSQCTIMSFGGVALTWGPMRGRGKCCLLFLAFPRLPTPALRFVRSHLNIILFLHFLFCKIITWDVMCHFVSRFKRCWWADSLLHSGSHVSFPPFPVFVLSCSL